MASVRANTVNNGLPPWSIIYDPNAGFVTGGGYVIHQAPWTTPPITGGGKDNYGFVAKYKKGASAPDGETEFQCKDCNINFHSTSLDWLIVTTIISGPNTGAQKAWYQGSGTINGSGSYRFQVTVIDNGNTDYFRIKIWEKANPRNIRYDNMPACDRRRRSRSRSARAATSSSTSNHPFGRIRAREKAGSRGTGLLPFWARSVGLRAPWDPRTDSAAATGTPRGRAAGRGRPSGRAG